MLPPYFLTMPSLMIHATSQHCQHPQTTLFLELRGNIAMPVTQRHSFHCFLQHCKNFSEHHFGFCFFHPSMKEDLLCPSPSSWWLEQQLKARKYLCRHWDNFILKDPSPWWTVCLNEWPLLIPESELIQNSQIFKAFVSSCFCCLLLSCTQALPTGTA